MSKTSKKESKSPYDKYKVKIGNGEIRYRRRVDVGYDPITNKRRQRTVSARTITELNEKIAKLVAERVDGRAATTSNHMSVKRFLLDEYLRHCERSGTLRGATLHQYRWRIEKRIIPSLGDVQLRKLSTLQVQRWVDDMVARYTPQTVRGIFTPLKAAMRQAVAWKLLTSSPCDGVKLPGRTLPPAPEWTSDEVRAFLAGTRDHRLHIAYRLLAVTGLRVGELVALTWHDVDLDVPCIYVRQTATRDKHGRDTFGPPKTSGSRRPVLLDDETASLLRDLPRAGVTVVTNTRGAPVDTDVIRITLARACRDLGLPVITPHQLRHLHATEMMAAGVHPTVAMARLGHTTLATMRHYQHPTVEHQRDAVTRLSVVECDNDVTTG